LWTLKSIFFIRKLLVIAFFFFAFRTMYLVWHATSVQRGFLRLEVDLINSVKNVGVTDDQLNAKKPNSTRECEGPLPLSFV